MADPQLDRFYRVFSTALVRGSAAAFIGAGISCSVGYPTWRGLLKDIATELKLDVDNEFDLAGIAQYHLNAAGRNRNKLAQLIRDTFLPTREPPRSLEIIARLPFPHVWTTNYDKLIEKAFEQQSRVLDVKARNDDLPLRNPDADTVLFKMHGTVDDPTDAVIATDDYELYLHRRAGFAKSLDSDFINRTMLFTGLSLRDPNLSHLFSMARSTFYENTPEHFAILRRPQRSDSSSDDDFAYQVNRYDLWLDDLQKRYNINVLSINDYEQLTDILAELEHRFSARNVFVSGSAPPDVWDDKRMAIEGIARAIGARIGAVGMNLVSGFGLVVGNSAISGFLDNFSQGMIPNLNRRLLLRPFPQGPFDNIDRAALWSRYREDMIRQAGTAIFIGGVRPDGSIAQGVLEEFDIAKRLNRTTLVVPIPNTASGLLYDRLISETPRSSMDSLQRDIFELADSNDTAALGNAVEQWLRSIEI